ncbi:MAG: LON peptidase substrate-binding domain-containing protein [Gemmatimonadota bacterium]|nr:LON peptidase substrate-binding domain-containing protein [Gemmatimonadota bacterium]
MASRLPLFPLDLVLFPGELLPLHIFEPRYRQLLADARLGDGRFGITAARAPRAGSLGTIAWIRGADTLPDGRSNIVVLGERRFEVHSLLPEDAPYLVAAVEEFGDAPDSAPPAEARHQLEAVAGRLRRALAILSDAGDELPAWEAEPEAFSFQAAALLEADPEARAPLLDVRQTRDRVRSLLALLPARLPGVESRAEVHVRARSNGKGHHGRDIVTG